MDAHPVTKLVADAGSDAVRQPVTGDRVSRFPIGATVTVQELELDPRAVIGRLRGHEPVSWLPALDAWFVTDRQLVVDAMRDADRFTVDDDRFTTAAVLGPSMLSRDGPEHRRHRGPFAPSFRPGVLREEFDRFLATEVSDLVAGLDPDGSDLRRRVAGPLAVATITRFLGLAEVGADDVLQWYQSIGTAITDLTTGRGIEPEGRQAVDEIHGRVQATLQGDGQSLLARIAAGGALRPEELGSAAAVLMFGAIETAEGMMANLLWHLLTTPGAWAAVREDRTLLANALEESLRLEPAAAVIDRYTTAEVDLGGVTIPGGELVTLSLLAANHDPDRFDRPDRFELTRVNAGEHVTFAQGPHACLGLHLARMETMAAADGLLDRIAEPRLDADRSSPPTGLIFRKPDAVVVMW